VPPEQQPQQYSAAQPQQPQQQQQQQQYPPPPAPQLSFRSPNGQFAPIWAPAGVAFAVPAPAPSTGIAYYAPNTGGNQQQQQQQQQQQNYGPEYGGPAGAQPQPPQQPKRPPVLLVGNFPPSATVRPTINPFAAYQVGSMLFN
jgi:hypothetical protein